MFTCTYVLIWGKIPFKSHYFRQAPSLLHVKSARRWNNHFLPEPSKISTNGQHLCKMLLILQSCVVSFFNLRLKWFLKLVLNLQIIHDCNTPYCEVSFWYLCLYDRFPEKIYSFHSWEKLLTSRNSPAGFFFFFQRLFNWENGYYNTEICREWLFNLIIWYLCYMQFWNQRNEYNLSFMMKESITDRAKYNIIDYLQKHLMHIKLGITSPCSTLLYSYLTKPPFQFSIFS